MRQPHQFHRRLVSSFCVGSVLLSSSCGDGDRTGNTGSPPIIATPDDEADLEATDQAFPQSVASGDPRPTSVILWTRLAPRIAGSGREISLDLVLSRDSGFEDVVMRRTVPLSASNDFVAKVRVDDLSPDTRYFYRFEYGTDQGHVRSRMGRTRTAPAPSSERPARFAFFSCQDYEGRYYNAYAHLLGRYGEDDLDFFVFLGDYIYETTSSGGRDDGRHIEFEDTAGALPLTASFMGHPGLAANSLANYRQLYQRYRGDPVLQRLHERYPVIAIWDDHEFSDDSWQAHGTYFAGAENELSVERKRNAERAFFEYMPIDVGLDASGDFSIPTDAPSDQTKIYRSFRWGAHLDLLLTDYRTFRPDHPIPEEAFPGAIAIPQGARVPTLDPYVDLTEPGYAREREQALAMVAELYHAAGMPPDAAGTSADAALTRFVSARWLDGMSEAAGGWPIFAPEAVASMPRGVSFAALGKTELFSSVGSRYLINQELYHSYASYRAAQAGGVLPDVYGPEQERWLDDSLAESETTWRIVASSISFLPLLLDFTHPLVAGLLPEEFPESLRQPLQLNADQWDGFPLKKQEVLALLGQRPNTVIISGDIHSSFAGGHNLGREGTHPVFELTGTAVSSVTMQGFVSELARERGLEGAESFANRLASLFLLSAAGNPLIPHESLEYAVTGSNGYVVVEVNEEAVEASFHHYPSEHVFTSYYGDAAALEALFTEDRLVLRPDELTRE